MNTFDLSVFPLFVVDAFTKKPFRGNSAAVVLLPFHESVSKEVKQKIAAEMNLSETAFITPKSEDNSCAKGKSFGLEWFTPTCEVSLCGHATLASAAVLFKAINNQSNELEFETLSGLLKAKKLDNKKIEIDLPIYNYKAVTKYDILVKAVVGTLPVKEVVIADSKNLLIRLEDEITKEEFESIKPIDNELLSAASDIIGVIITTNGNGKANCKDDEQNQYDFISRYFAPWLGVSEDPVTGSAHSVLAPYWSNILHKNEMYARQCSPRGGNLNLKLIKDRILISGDSIIVIEGKIKF